MRRPVGFAALPFFILAAALATPAAAQAPNGDTRALRVFLDCQTWGCDFDHFRTEIEWVSWVRDRTVADVHVLVTGESTGAGGRQFDLAFLGRGEQAGRSDTLQATTSATATEFEQREQLTETLERGLLGYALRSPVADALRITVEREGEPSEAAMPGAVDDPWNFWVFEVGVDGSLDGESRQSSQEVSGRLEANRTTPEWKIELELDGNYNEEQIELSDGREIDVVRRGMSSEVLAVRSLGATLSAGLQAAVRTSSFRNQDLTLSVSPAVEYNVFPYAESTRRQLTLRYSIGPRYFEYTEPTIFGREQERLLEHELEAGLSLRQPWGSVGFGLGASHYLGWEPGAQAPAELRSDDSPRYRFSFGGGLEFRVLRGLDLEIDGHYSRIQNQLYLPRGDASDEDILLRVRELETDYEYRIGVGLSYTFGSIYNNVVNPRFTGGGRGRF